MTAHELARQMLAGPDLPVFTQEDWYDDYEIREEYQLVTFYIAKDKFGDWRYVAESEGKVVYVL